MHAFKFSLDEIFSDLFEYIGITVFSFACVAVHIVSRIFLNISQETKVNGVRAFDFGGHTNASKKKEVDPREVEARQKRAQVLFCGQNISSLLKEVYDLLSTTLNLQVKGILTGQLSALSQLLIPLTFVSLLLPPPIKQPPPPKKKIYLKTQTLSMVSVFELGE